MYKFIACTHVEIQFNQDNHIGRPNNHLRQGLIDLRFSDLEREIEISDFWAFTVVFRVQNILW